MARAKAGGGSPDKRMPPVKLRSMNGREFRDSFSVLQDKMEWGRRGGGPASYRNVNLSRDFTISLDAGLFTGCESVSPKGRIEHSGIQARIPVNLGRMSNLDYDLLAAMGVELSTDQQKVIAQGTCDPRYGGNFDTVNAGTDFSEFKTYKDSTSSMPGTPVGLKIEYDAEKEDAAMPLERFTVTPAIDFKSFGDAMTEELNMAREIRGKGPLNPAQYGRVKTVVSSDVCKDGLAGMNEARVCQITAKCAAAEHLMSRRGAESIPTPDQVKYVSDLYARTFNSLVDELSKNRRAATFPRDPRSPGTTVSCPALRDMGLDAKNVGGAKVLAVQDGANMTSCREGVEMFNEAFNAKWRQVINERVPGPDGKPGEYVHGRAVVEMGNRMSMDAYVSRATDPQDAGKATRLVLVQPAMNYTMAPRAEDLGLSVGTMMDGLPDGTRAGDYYSKDAMDAAYELSCAFDDPDDPFELGPDHDVNDRVVMARMMSATKQFSAICHALGRNLDDTLQRPSLYQTYGPEDDFDEVYDPEYD